MTKKQSIPADMEQQVMGHVRAILHMHMGEVVRANAKRTRAMPMRIINRIENINTAVMRDINEVFLTHRLAAADNLVVLEAIHKLINKAQDAKVERQLQMHLPAGWHIEEGLVTKQEFIVQNEPRKLSSRIDTPTIKEFTKPTYGESLELDDMEVYDAQFEDEIGTNLAADKEPKAPKG